MISQISMSFQNIISDCYIRIYGIWCDIICVEREYLIWYYLIMSEYHNQLWKSNCLLLSQKRQKSHFPLQVSHPEARMCFRIYKLPPRVFFWLCLFLLKDKSSFKNLHTTEGSWELDSTYTLHCLLRRVGKCWQVAYQGHVF